MASAKREDNKGWIVCFLYANLLTCWIVEKEAIRRVEE